jgi:uncharacterized SAM-binding protein YcdF (DUF218 family)
MSEPASPHAPLCSHCGRRLRSPHALTGVELLSSGIAVLAMTTTWLVVLFWMPMLEYWFKHLNGTLPAMTQTTIDLVHLVGGHIVVPILAAIGGAFLLRKARFREEALISVALLSVVVLGVVVAQGLIPVLSHTVLESVRAHDVSPH